VQLGVLTTRCGARFRARSRARGCCSDRSGDGTAGSSRSKRSWSDADEEFAGIVVDKMSRRRAEMQEMLRPRAAASCGCRSSPTRGLIGYRGEFSHARGTGVMSRLF
jgi:predicted membrane GTPase involved in stress response